LLKNSNCDKGESSDLLFFPPYPQTLRHRDRGAEQLRGWPPPPLHHLKKEKERSREKEREREKGARQQKEES